MLHRLAEEKDLPSVYALHMEAEANPWLTYDPMTPEEFAPIYREILPTQTLFVVDKEGKVAATYRLLPKRDRQAHILYLGGFTVAAAFRGQGLGRSMLSHIESEARKAGKKRIELTVDSQNAPAIALYEQRGFVKEGLLRFASRHSATGEYRDEFLMALIL